MTWSDYISHLAWELLGIHQEEQERPARERDVWERDVWERGVWEEDVWISSRRQLNG